jgi:hypothetical protein
LTKSQGHCKRKNKKIKKGGIWHFFVPQDMEGRNPSASVCFSNKIPNHASPCLAKKLLLKEKSFQILAVNDLFFEVICSIIIMITGFKANP